MRISQTHRLTLRCTALLLLCSLTFQMLCSPVLLAQDVKQGEFRVSEVDWKMEGGKVYISFGILGSPGEKYSVSLALLRELDSRFRFVPKSVQGDIGVVAKPAEKLMIVWDFSRDLPLGLRGEDFYFEVTVERVTAGSGWYYYVLAGAAIVGGGAAFLLKKGGVEATTEPSRELPSPPIRPVP